MSKLPINIINKILIYNIHPVAVELKKILKQIQKGKKIIDNTILSNFNNIIEYQIDYNNSIFKIYISIEPKLNFYYESYSISHAMLCFINKNKKKYNLSYLVTLFIKIFN